MNEILNMWVINKDNKMRKKTDRQKMKELYIHYY